MESQRRAFLLDFGDGAVMLVLTTGRSATQVGERLGVPQRL